MKDFFNLYIPKQVSAHFIPIVLLSAGLIATVVVGLNQRNRQLEKLFLSYIDTMYQTKAFDLDGTMSVVSDTDDLLEYPILASVSFKNSAFPVIDLPMQMVEKTPFGSFEGVRIYSERSYGKLKDAPENWIAVSTSDVLDYTYEGYLEEYIPNIFAIPHSDFWKKNLQSASQTQSFLKNHIENSSISFEKEDSRLIVSIDQKLFRKTSIEYFESLSGFTMPLEERKWYEDMTSLIPSKITVENDGSFRLDIDSKLLSAEEKMQMVSFDMTASPFSAGDMREPAELIEISELPSSVVLQPALREIALRGVNDETDAPASGTLEESGITQEESSDEEAQAGSPKPQVDANAANLFELRKERYMNRTWTSN